MPTKKKSLVLTPQQVSKEIKRRNSLFKNATKAERRVMIAEDVIQQIKAKKFIPTSGVFATSDVISSLEGGSDDDRSIREILLSTNATCDCCALGGMMLSCTLFNNKENVSDWTDHFENLGVSVEESDSRIKNGFKQIFSKSQLELIEIAFETGDGYNCFDHEYVKKHTDGRLYLDYYDDGFNEDNVLSKPEIKKYYAVQFGKKYESDDDRMIAIMKNIIKNKGEFNPKPGKI